MSTATVAISLNDLDVLRQAKIRADARIQELETKLVTTERAALGGDLAGYIEAIETATIIIQYAVANLPPETSPGWPYEKLRLLATHLGALPGFTATMRDIAGDFVKRASEIEPYERERAARPKHVVRATQADFGPQTEEARAAHAVRDLGGLEEK